MRYTREKLHPSPKREALTDSQPERDVQVRDTPWEDTLILAFRDMQWIRKMQDAHQMSAYGQAEPPALMVKLDGKAESKAGDVLTGYDGRYFLLEFKSALSRFHTEKGKPVHERLAMACPHDPADAALLTLSKRGHFLAYPHIEGREVLSAHTLPIHRVDLMCVPYCLLLHESDRQVLARNPTKLDHVFYGESHGLNVEEMARYLKALGEAAEVGGDGNAPFKAIIASPAGLFWPLGRVSDFSEFVSNAGLPLESGKSPSQRLREGIDLILNNPGNNAPRKGKGPRIG
ncbi:TPA: hypothetical protein ACP32D_006284 [Pseudomonas aeruginosa]